MDFKVAGTMNGITAIQMDLKNDGIDADSASGAVSGAADGRLFILDKDASPASPQPRDQHLSPLRAEDHPFEDQPG